MSSTTILTLVSERIPKRFGLDPLNDIQVLTPMHKGVVGTTHLNRKLQEALNPGEGGVARGEFFYRVGDKVMQIRNNYDKEVFNGDIGRITALSVEARELTVVFDGRAVAYDFSDLDEIVHAYAVSVHKAQGSEYPAVIFPVLTQHFILLQRNLYLHGGHARAAPGGSGRTAVGAAPRRRKQPQRAALHDPCGTAGLGGLAAQGLGRGAGQRDARGVDRPARGPRRPDRPRDLGIRVRCRGRGVSAARQAQVDWRRLCPCTNARLQERGWPGSEAPPKAHARSLRTWGLGVAGGVSELRLATVHGKPLSPRAHARRPTLRGTEAPGVVLSSGSGRDAGPQLAPRSPSASGVDERRRSTSRSAGSGSLK